MLDAIIVDLSGIATLITLIGAIAVAFKIYPFSRTQLTILMLIVSVGCLLGSLYMSDILKLKPCDLCWWQRVFMYPTVVLSAVALYRKNTINLFTNVAGLSIIGLLFALFNVYVQFGPKETTALFCDLTNPCSEIDVIALGFLTLPMMSAVAFLFLLACAWAAGLPDDRTEITNE